jgi:hypothetical protein
MEFELHVIPSGEIAPGDVRFHYHTITINLQTEIGNERLAQSRRETCQ